MSCRLFSSMFCLSLMLLATATFAQEAKPIRVGIIGLDTSHVVAFTKLLNDPKASGELAGARVVAAYPGGSPDIPSSADRLEGFTKALRDMNVEIVDSIDQLLTKVDAVLLESVDGRPHLEQARPVLKAGKPVFIDKPVAASLKDALAIYRLAAETKTPCFSSSSLRFFPGTQEMITKKPLGEIMGCMTYGPCSLEPHHPDLFWYGIHGVETLFTLMGTGCQQVQRVQTEDTELVTGVWEGGRIGTFRGIRAGKSGYGAFVFGSKGIGPAASGASYQQLLVEICKFFRTGKPPVSAEETIEIMAFMEAADESKRQGGKLVSIESVLEKARHELTAK
jgi:predicted dehydrogenase